MKLIAELIIQFSPLTFILFSILFIFSIKKKKSKIIKIILLICALGHLTASYAYYIESQTLLIKEQNIYLSENKEDPLKIALVADLHRGLFKNDLPMEKIIKQLEKEAPDVIFILGDYIGVQYIPKEDISYFRALDIPIYSIFGNHDVRKGTEILFHLERLLEEENIILLRNQKMELNIKGKIYEIVGLEDLRFNGPEGIDWKLLEEDTNKPRIVLAHNPNTLLFLEDQQQFDIMFSGHTHGKQVNIGLPVFDASTKRRFPFVEGYKEIDHRRYYISAGIGMSGLPVRLFIPPRIDMIYLYD